MAGGWLSGWVGGVASAVVASWINGKVHNYRERSRTHLDDIREKVLIPLRAGLEEQLGLYLTGEKPVVSVVPSVKHYDVTAKASQEPAKWGRQLMPAFPSINILRTVESALYYDAKERHFSEVLGNLDSFNKAWMDHVGECHRWISQMASDILRISELPPFPEGTDKYVMHYQLAGFVHNRLFRFATGALRTGQQGATWCLKGGDYILACGELWQMDALLETLDSLIESERERGTILWTKSSDFHVRYLRLAGQLSSTIASRRLHGRCDLVPFF